MKKWSSVILSIMAVGAFTSGRFLNVNAKSNQPNEQQQSKQQRNNQNNNSTKKNPNQSSSPTNNKSSTNQSNSSKNNQNNNNKSNKKNNNQSNSSSQKNNSSKETNQNQNVVTPLSQEVSYQIPIYYINGHQKQNGQSLNITGFPTLSYSINNRNLSLPTGYKLVKGNPHYRLTLQNQGYTIKKLNNHHWNNYTGKITFAIKAEKVNNVVILYQNSNSKTIKKQKLAGLMGQEITRKMLNLPNGMKIPGEITWIPHYFSNSPQNIIVSVVNKKNNKQKANNNKKTSKNNKSHNKNK